MTSQNRQLAQALAALLAGEALYWFIGGAFATHSALRNTLVGLQFMSAAAVFTWALVTARRDPIRESIRPLR